MNCPNCHKDIDHVVAETSATAEINETEQFDWDIDHEWIVYTCPLCEEDLNADNAHEAILICSPGTDEYNKAEVSFQNLKTIEGE